MIRVPGPGNGSATMPTAMITRPIITVSGRRHADFSRA
jgi:hypothetical protein